MLLFQGASLLLRYGLRSRFMVRFNYYLCHSRMSLAIASHGNNDRIAI